MQIVVDKEKFLGQGYYSDVFTGTFNGRQIAVKKVKLYQVNNNEEKALQQLNHPNVIKLFHSESNDEFKFFAMELCAASLDQLFLESGDPRKYKGPALPPHLEVFRQLASGLDHIHSKNLFHRDIKPENVLISVDSTTGLVTIKWADFGLSKFVNERGSCTLSGCKGTTNYFAPELLRSLENNETPGRGTIKSDVFSFALVIGYLLLDGQHLYGSKYHVPINILNKIQVNMDKIDRSHYARGLLTKMLEDYPNKRISSEEVVRELKNIKIEIAKKEKEFRELCKNENVDLNQIKLLIKNGIDVNGKDDEGQNALHLLCRHNSSEQLIDAMEFLIENGIDVNGKTNNGANAFHYLCFNNSSEKIVEAIQFLIKNGIDVNGKDEYGENALHWLCANNSSEKLIEAMQFLIKNGIVLNGKTNNGTDYALHYLCCNNSSEKLIDAIRFLIQTGVDVNTKGDHGWNALHCLCWNNKSEKIVDAIRFLIKNGIDVNGKDEYGNNALHILCRYNKSEKLIDAIRFLMAHGIQSNGLNARSLLNENIHYRNNTNTIEEIVQLLDRTAISN